MCRVLGTTYFTQNRWTKVINHCSSFSLMPCLLIFGIYFVLEKSVIFALK